MTDIKHSSKVMLYAMLGAIIGTTLSVGARQKALNDIEQACITEAAFEIKLAFPENGITTRRYVCSPAKTPDPQASSEKPHCGTRQCVSI